MSQFGILTVLELARKVRSSTHKPKFIQPQEMQGICQAPTGWSFCLTV